MTWIKVMKAIGLVLTGLADIIMIVMRNRKEVSNISKE